VLTTNRGVPEFEEVSYPTLLLLEQLYVVRKRRFSAVAAFNVTHGYVPLSILAARMTSRVEMSERDLLALRSAEQNLTANGFDCPETTLHHDFGWLPQGIAQFDLIAGTLRGDEPDAAIEVGIEKVAMRLVPGGVAMVAGGSTPITRMLKVLDGMRGIIVTDRKRYRGSSVAVFTRAASAN
jgi:16S rRNA G1207 methylase RsmC